MLYSCAQGKGRVFWTYYLLYLRKQTSFKQNKKIRKKKITTDIKVAQTNKTGLPEDSAFPTNCTTLAEQFVKAKLPLRLTTNANLTLLTPESRFI